MTDSTSKQASSKTAPVVETVTMSDGKVVDFPGKRRLLKTSTIAPDGTVQVRLDWRNGETRTFTVPEALKAKFAAHGAEQKLGDEIAGLKDAQGGEADIEDCVMAVDELIDRLYEGEWGTQRDPSGIAGTSILLRALREAYPKQTIEALKTFLKTKTQAQKIAMRTIGKLEPIVKRLEAEKAAKKAANGKAVDTSKMLDELEGDGSTDEGEAAAA